jgi:hypothetical protein
LCFYLDLLRRELQAITASGTRFSFDRAASVAAMQEQTLKSRHFVTAYRRFGRARGNPEATKPAGSGSVRPVEWFQSTCNMQYGHVGGAQDL